MKIFKISGYMIDTGDASSRDVINLLGRYLYLRQLHVEETEITGKTLADFPESVDLADLEKCFDHRTERVAEYDRPLPQEGEVWRHFKGNEVKIVGIAQHTEWNTLSVVYTYSGKLFNRPLDMFMNEVDREKYPDAKQKYRFERYKND